MEKMMKSCVKNSGWIKMTCAFVLMTLLCLGLATAMADNPAVDFSLPAGTYDDPQEVTLSCPEGWQICYTTDGSDPYHYDGFYYVLDGICPDSSSVTIPVTESTVITAVAYQYDPYDEYVEYRLGPALSRYYQITSSGVVIDGKVRFAPGGGTYETDEQTVILSGPAGWKICYTTDGSDPYGDDPMGHDVLTGSGRDNPVTITLSDPAVVKAVAYTEDSRGGSAYNFIFSNVAEQTYTVIRPGTVQDGDVYFYPGGGTYESSQEVTLTCPEGWRICYTTDGSAPVDRPYATYQFIGVCSSSNSVTFTVSESTTVRAVPYQDRGNNYAEDKRYIFGQEGSQEYLIVGSGSTLSGDIIFSPGGGIYEGSQRVTLSCVPGWKICYTTNGSSPVSYNIPIGECFLSNTVTFTVSESATIRAVPFQNNGDEYIFGREGSQEYIIISSGSTVSGDIVFSPGGGTYGGAQEVTLSCASGWRICYTTDGSAPVFVDVPNGTYSSSNTVTFTVSESATVRAVPYQDRGSGYVSSQRYIFGQEGSQKYIIAGSGEVVFSPGGGTYEGAQEVTLSCASGWQICYTTDGSDPVSNGFPSGKGYANPVVVPVSKSCTVRAVSYKENSYGNNPYTISDIFEQTYTIIPPLPELLSGVNTVTLEAVNDPVSYRFTPAEDGYYLFVFPGYNNVVEVYDGETRIAPAAGVTPSVRCFAELESGKNYTVRFTALQTAGDFTATVQRLYPVALDPETEHGGFAMDTYAGGYAAEDGNIIGLQVAGGTVSLIPEPEEGYTLTEITVVDASGETVADATGGWTMPEGGVTVYARFDRAYTLSFEGDDNVYFNMSRIGGLGGGAFRPVPVLPGQTVQLSWQCEDPAYIPDTFSVTTASGAAVPFAFRWLEEMNRQVMEFEMPEEDVTASVTSCLFSFDRADFVLPADTRVIEDNAFDGDRNISVAVIPSGCERIGKEAFKDCKNLQRIRIPVDCTVGEDAFIGCDWVLVYGAENSSAWDYCQAHPENTQYMPDT